MPLPPSQAYAYCYHHQYMHAEKLAFANHTYPSKDYGDLNLVCRGWMQQKLVPRKKGKTVKKYFPLRKTVELAATNYTYSIHIFFFP